MAPQFKVRTFLLILATICSFLLIAYFYKAASNDVAPTITPRVVQQRQMLDFEDFPNLIGPRVQPVDTNKSLVVMAIGKSDKPAVDLVVRRFSAPQFSFMFFHYDDSTWHEFDWYNKLNVVAIRLVHKMKWWYIKRFLYPDIARAFKHIIILDADVRFDDPFDPVAYLELADSFNLDLHQPAHVEGSKTGWHGVLYAMPGDHIGRYSDFVECGPASFFSSRGYQCVYDLLQEDLTSGWGLDTLWVDYVQSVCGFGMKSVGVIDTFVMIHEVPTYSGTASSLPGFNDGAYQEWDLYNRRFPMLRRGPSGQQMEKFGTRPVRTPPVNLTE